MTTVNTNPEIIRIENIPAIIWQRAQMEGLLPPGNAMLFGYFAPDMRAFCGLYLYARTGKMKCDYVLPAYRRQGILTQMIVYRLRVACEKGVDKVVAYCTPVALGAHIKLGASPVYAYKNGITRVEYYLENLSATKCL
jgi:GNAT superfamily N-acetyltransferase